MITISDITTGAINGTGSFDKLMQTAKLHLMEEFKQERITGDKYAEAYISIMNNVLAQSIQFSLQVTTASANEELIKQKIKTEKAQIEDQVDGVGVVGTVGKQKEVYDAQIKGFKDDALMKATNAMIGVWQVQRTTDEGISPNNQNMLHDVNIGNAVTALGQQVGFSVTVAVKPVVTLTIAVNRAEIRGNVGSPGSEVRSLYLTDVSGTRQIINTDAIVVGADGNFTLQDLEMPNLADGLITVTMKILTPEYDELEVTDTDYKS